MLDDFRRIRRFYFIHGLRNNLGGDVVAPSLVLGWFSVFLCEGRHKRLAGRSIYEVMPNAGPGPHEAAFPRRPSKRRIKAKATDRECQSEFRILLQEIRDLVAGEIDCDEVRLSVADLQQIGREVCRIGRDEIVTGELTAIGLHEALGDAQKIMPK